ncbi:CoA ester lyase [Hyphomonas sp. ND6WE1B]|uniref:HpcH/HpaI aldolase/citrate lyase family protein n=1 Tax=Hyphomonas sp. ND6WE1B TaxID=1848191 RepID=UPI0008076380|nr:CoA ester lyase [Hyphomonas sp. ND6WE1B]
MSLKPTRSFMFVPGNKENMIEKSASAGADALILDLEDSVPPGEKVEARNLVASKIDWLLEKGQRIYVRINRSPHLYDLDDLFAVIRPGVEGIYISKPNGYEDVVTASSMISEAEARNGVALGTVGLIPLLETAKALQDAYEIACVPRVTAIVGATAKNADVARALNTVWSPEGRETIYLKSRIVMAARAAGKRPIGGVWQQIRDLDGLRASSLKDRALGMDGELALHPSNVPVINEVYSPSKEEVAYYQGMIDALEQAKSEGRASVVYDGEHIDIAHAKTAQDIIALAEALG